MNTRVHPNPKVTEIMQSSHTYGLGEEGKLIKEIEQINANDTYTVEVISPNGPTSTSTYLGKEIKKRCIDIFGKIHNAVIVKQDGRHIFIYAGAIAPAVEKILASQVH